MRSPVRRTLSRQDPRPLYRQLKEMLLADIEAERLTPRAKLPSERELIELYGVSRITVRQAVQELVQAGYLTSHPGRGFYVTDRPGDTYELELLRSFTATALAHGRKPGSRLLEAAVRLAPPTVAGPLKVVEGAEVVSLRRLRLLDGEPVAVAHDWIPMHLVPDLLSLDWTHGNRSLYAELRERYRYRPVRGKTVLSARLASREEAGLLGLKSPAAVLTVEQIAFDARGSPINLTFSVHHPTHYPLSLEQSG